MTHLHGFPTSLLKTSVFKKNVLHILHTTQDVPTELLQIAQMKGF